MHLVPPSLFLPHADGRCFIGPGTVRLPDGDILMVAPWGSPPVTEAGRVVAMPMTYRSPDGGRT